MADDIHAGATPEQGQQVLDILLDMPDIVVALSEKRMRYAQQLYLQWVFTPGRQRVLSFSVFPECKDIPRLTFYAKHYHQPIWEPQ
jgi:hypothetical protein